MTGYLTVKQVSEKTGLRECSVTKRCREGTVTGVKKSKEGRLTMWYIPRTSLVKKFALQ